jgi:hypothetical protein
VEDPTSATHFFEQSGQMSLATHPTIKGRTLELRSEGELLFEDDDDGTEITGYQYHYFGLYVCETDEWEAEIGDLCKITAMVGSSTTLDPDYLEDVLDSFLRPDLWDYEEQIEFLKALEKQSVDLPHETWPYTSTPIREIPHPINPERKLILGMQDSICYVTVVDGENVVAHPEKL